MAHLWVRDGGDWAVRPLEEPDGLRLDSWPLAEEQAALTGRTPCRRGVWIVRGAPLEKDRPSWCLFGPRTGTVRVNGFPLVGGLRLLRDRDEIRVDGAGIGRCFFSTEEPPRIESYSPPRAGADSLDPEHAPRCPRCQEPLSAGEPVVRCPGCRVLFHQDPENGLPCWTYGNCSICGRETDLDGGHLWSPA